MDLRFKKLLFKTIIFIISLSIAWWLIKSGFLHQLVVKILPIQFLAEIIAGMFYTSFLTTPLAIAMFLVIAKDSNPIIVALLGGLGGAFADFLIVRFFKDNSKDLNTAGRQLQLQKVTQFLKSIKMEFVIPLIGALIIASPFPDEIGLLMLGASKLKPTQLLISTYILDTAGILLIVTPINLLS